MEDFWPALHPPSPTWQGGSLESIRGQGVAGGEERGQSLWPASPPPCVELGAVRTLPVSDAGFVNTGHGRGSRRRGQNQAELQAAVNSLGNASPGPWAGVRPRSPVAFPTQTAGSGAKHREMETKKIGPAASVAGSPGCRHPLDLFPAWQEGSNQRQSHYRAIPWLSVFSRWRGHSKSKCWEQAHYDAGCTVQ